MKKISFQCETVTPLILGESLKGQVELRPPAFKAGMRFWWRAMNAHLNLAELKKQEIAIFGGGGKTAIGSGIEIVLIEGTEKRDKPYDYGEENIKIEGIDKNGKLKGLQYFMYTLFHLKKQGQYFPSETKFEIIFYFKDNDAKIQLTALASFWLLVFLGNLGERSRRGLGGFKINKVTDDNNINSLVFNFLDYSEENIKSGIWKIRTLFNPEENPLINNTYSHVFNNKIYLSKTTFTSWKDALNDIGKEMYDFRLEKREGQDRSKMTDNLSASFGLPVKHRMYSIAPEKFDRRASPLLIKVIFIKEQRYKWLILRLEGDFLPNGYDNLKNTKTGNSIGSADLKSLENFIASLNTKTREL